MPGPTAPKIVLCEEERQDLLMLIRAHKTPQHLSFRAQIILRLAAGHDTSEVAKHFETTRLTSDSRKALNLLKTKGLFFALS